MRASGAPGAKLLAGAERNHGGKRGLERGAGLTTATPGQGPALRLDAAAARLHSEGPERPSVFFLILAPALENLLADLAGLVTILINSL